MFEFGSESPENNRDIGCCCLHSGSGSLRKYMGFLRLKHQTKVKLLLVAIICALEVPTGAVCDADPCVVQTHRK